MNKTIDLIVWDLETTGFVAPEAKILEIGAFIVRDGQIEEKHWVLKNPDTVIPQKITEITGIDQAIIDVEGRDPKECLLEFLPLLMEAKLNVTHNGVKFDIEFLVAYVAFILGHSKEDTEVMRQHIRSTAYDTAVFFKAAKLNLRQKEGESFVEYADRIMDIKAYGVKFSLGLCCDEHGIDRTDVKQHRALGDVFLTHALFKKICFNTLKSQKVVEDPTYCTSSFEVKVLSKTKSSGAPLEHKIDNFEKVTKLHPNEVHVLFCEETKEVIKTYLPPELVC